MHYSSKQENYSTDTLRTAIDEISVKNIENKEFFDGNGTSLYGVLIVQFRRVLLTQYLFQ